MATRWFVLLAAILAGADQLTKHAARVWLEEGIRQEIIPDFFRITLNFNKGIAWGMLPEWSEYFTYFAIVMVLVILMVLRKLDQDEVWLKIALAFQMAGAIGNMTDRLVRHEVTDFIDIRLFLPGTSWQYDWPIFNLADSFVVVGTIVLVTVLAFSREGDRPAAARPPATVRAGLGASEDTDGWAEEPLPPGSVSAEEALIELPAEPGSEMLRPLEEADDVRAEKAEKPEKPEDHAEEPVSPEDEDKLDELSRRPER